MIIGCLDTNINIHRIPLFGLKMKPESFFVSTFFHMFTVLGMYNLVANINFENLTVAWTKVWGFFLFIVYTLKKNCQESRMINLVITHKIQDLNTRFQELIYLSVNKEPPKHFFQANIFN